MGLLVSLAAHAQQDSASIVLIATGANRAIIEVNGERLILSDSEPIQSGVTLLSADSEEAVILFSGSELVLRSDEVSPPILDNESLTNSSSEPITLWADSSGFFFANGNVNGNSTRFLVDTGADIVTFSRPQADKLGIDYTRGQPGYASTASGIATLRTLKLHSLSIGNITLYNVPISVVMGRFPDVPLLGGSFLNKLDMNRVGNKMVLKKR